MLTVAVGEAVEVLLCERVDELDGTKKDTVAMYPSPLILKSEANTTVREFDVDVTESPAEVRDPSSALLLLGPS